MRLLIVYCPGPNMDFAEHVHGAAPELGDLHLHPRLIDQPFRVEGGRDHRFECPRRHPVHVEHAHAGNVNLAGVADTGGLREVGQRHTPRSKAGRPGQPDTR